MSDRIVPRGPDSSGEWIDGDANLGFAHRRLAILDLSPAGHQPMESACGRYVITYNGEIYNFTDLRTELELAGLAPAWRGHSDTEILLAAISAWGIDATLAKLAGMFAFALWDKQQRVLTLGRDRFGEKPLYYGTTGAGFVFASTLGPIIASPGFERQINPHAVSSLLARAYIPAPHSIFRNIYKLPPGTLLSVDCSRTLPALASAPALGPTGPYTLRRYYDYAQTVLDGAADPIADRQEALDEIERALNASIKRQLVADVPVGTFLSGGIDSSLVTAIAQKNANHPVRSFTIGFSEANFDEAVFARSVSKVIGTDHTELYVSPQDAQAVIPQLSQIYDEPFADSSQIPTFLVSRLARQNVTVSLSGDAGDELFGGYHRHIQFPRLWRLARRLPGPLASLGFGAASRIPPAAWNAMSDLRKKRRSEQFGHNAQRGLKLLAASRTFDDMFDAFLNDWFGHPSPVTDPSARHSTLGLDPALARLPLELQMMHADATTYLPDDILCKVDRAAMAVSLETRVPFLDPQVVAVAARTPMDFKFANGGGKAILKELLCRHVPRELVDRPKAGFAIPIGIWLRGPLRDWAESLLSESSLKQTGLLEPKPIIDRWQKHLRGEDDATQPIWSILMLQSWLNDVN